MNTYDFSQLPQPISNDRDEMFNRGIYYMNNNENQLDIPKAIYWLTNAADRKHVQANKYICRRKRFCNTIY